MNSSESARRHKEESAGLDAVQAAVVTVSDSRTEATDESGRLIQELLRREGHRITGYRILPDDEEALRSHLLTLLESDADAVIISGGTGLSRRDRTIEAAQGLIEKEIPGFGELFRHLSYAEQIGTAAILSRSLAGAAQGKLLVCLPGSKAAVELALKRILLPELRHLVWELRR